MKTHSDMLRLLVENLIERISQTFDMSEDEARNIAIKEIREIFKAYPKKE
jgi:hypothetical protein